MRAIAGAVLAGQILQALNATLAAPAAKASAQRLTVQFGAYGTFMSFFGLANLTAASPDFRGVVDYASSLTLELVTNATLGAGAVSPDDVAVRFLFANGSASDANAPAVYPLFGQAETALPWADFAAGINSFAVGDTASWCQACGNTTGVCAASATSGSGSGSGSSSSSNSGSSGSSGITPGVAGGIGVLSMFGLILLLGGAAALSGFRVVKKGAAAGKGLDGGAGTATDTVGKA